jgi:hypothetical protein
MRKHELIDIGTDKRGWRDKTGRFRGAEDVRRSLAQRHSAHATAKHGYGERGDRRAC